MTRDFSSVTEVAGDRLTRQAIAMMYTRYRFAASRCRGKDVLEVACGAGQGLGLLHREAAKVVGGDYTRSLLRRAMDHYHDRVSLVSLDAHGMPFPSGCFDVVLMYEAIYYLSDPGRFLFESRRLLRSGGTLLLCSVNPRWSGFCPSPHSVRYFPPQELKQLLESSGFRTSLFGAYAVRDASWGGRGVSLLRSLAASLHLMPKTMRGKERLKRLFYGELLEAPAELREEAVVAEEPVSLGEGEAEDRYKITFAVGVR